MDIKTQRLGGKIMAERQRRTAIENYYKNPKICLYCNSVIEIIGDAKVTEVRKKKFCDHSCASKFTNSKRVKGYKSKNIKLKIEYNPTKDQLFNNCKNWQSARSIIRTNANLVINKSNRLKICMNCGYDKHVEVCHIKAVSEFDGSDYLSEINNINNLVYLCPNCHWEFDNNSLVIRAYGDNIYF